MIINSLKKELFRYLLDYKNFYLNLRINFIFKEEYQYNVNHKLWIFFNIN